MQKRNCGFRRQINFGKSVGRGVATFSSLLAFGAIARRTQCFGTTKLRFAIKQSPLKVVGDKRSASYFQQFTCNHSDYATLIFVSLTKKSAVAYLITWIALRMSPGIARVPRGFGESTAEVAVLVKVPLPVARFSKRASFEFANPVICPKQQSGSNYRFL